MILLSGGTIVILMSYICRSAQSVNNCFKKLLLSYRVKFNKLSYIPSTKYNKALQLTLHIQQQNC